MSTPRARDEGRSPQQKETHVCWAKHRLALLGFNGLHSFIEGEVLCALACAFHGLSLTEKEMEVGGHHPQDTHGEITRVERAFGGTP